MPPAGVTAATRGYRDPALHGGTKRVAPASARTTAGDPDFMESLARGLTVIRAFGSGRRQLTGSDVSTITGLSRAAARRCLHTLSVLGYATSIDGRFELTPAVLALAQPFLGAASLATVARPVLARLCDRLQESSGVAVRDGEEIMFIARAAARRILAVEVSVGSRLPAAHTASGRVLLANENDEARARFLARVKLPRLTPRSIVDRKELRAELERVRSQGYAIVDQELELGLRSIAVPIRRGEEGPVVAALNVGLQAGRIDIRAMQREFAPVLGEAAAEISRALG